MNESEISQSLWPCSMTSVNTWTFIDVSNMNVADGRNDVGTYGNDQFELATIFLIEQLDLFNVVCFAHLQV